MKYVVSLCANTLIYSINTPFVAGAKLTTIYFIQENPSEAQGIGVWRERQNVELLPFEKPYPINFEMLTLTKVRAAFFFFGSLFLFALAIEQKEKVNKNFSFL